MLQSIQRSSALHGSLLMATAVTQTPSTTTKHPPIEIARQSTGAASIFPGRAIRAAMIPWLIAWTFLARLVVRRHDDAPIGACFRN